MEKHTQPDTLPPPAQAAPAPRRWGWPKIVLAAVAGVYAFHAVGSYTCPGMMSAGHHKHKSDLKCPVQPKPLEPSSRIEWTDESKAKSIELFQAAVRIPTQSYDDNGEPEEDPRWAPFTDFQNWLKEAFPTAWSTANVEFINTLGILATFEGSDKSLKPLLLMSHYDVTPAPEATYDRWTHPPFDAVNDGEFVWGRGAADDKSLLVAQWEAITHLLESGFKPRRTLILSHGFDEEEVFARRGQGQIAPFLEKRYGKDSLLMVIDEGTGTLDNFYGTPFAVPAMGEKGYLDIIISVGTDGGHSSVPPKHTGIGVMSQIVNELESNPYPVKLTTASPLLTSLMCAAEHGSSFPKSWRKLLHPKGWAKLAHKVAANSAMERALVGTTTAVDVIDGGVKVNALPELVTALVNFRIDFSESVGGTKERIQDLVGKIAKKNELKFYPWSEKNTTERGGRFVSVDVMGQPLEPAPRTPSTGGVWELFAGTVKATLPGPNGEERIVTPFASTGNTDCKMYYNLSKNVYRFMGGPIETMFGIHTVDERAGVEGHFSIVNWLHAIIQNADAYNGEY